MSHYVIYYFIYAIPFVVHIVVSFRYNKTITTNGSVTFIQPQTSTFSNHFVYLVNNTRGTRS